MQKCHLQQLVSPSALGSGWREAQLFHQQTPHQHPGMGSQLPSTDQIQEGLPMTAGTSMSGTYQPSTCAALAACHNPSAAAQC